MNIRFLLVVSFVLLAQSGFAQTGPKHRRGGIRVNTVNPAYDVEEMRKKAEVEVDYFRSTWNVTPQERDQQFEKAGLTDAISGLDDLDRDVLFMDLNTKSVEEVLAAHPKISVDKIKHAWKFLRESSK